MRVRIPSFVSMLFTIVAVAHSQTGTISGVVRHADTREPIPSVNVRVLETTFGASTGEDGSYNISGIPAGAYKIRATAVGHRPTDVSVTVGGGAITLADIPLADEAVRASEVMVYGASLRRERITDAPAAISVLDARDIMRRGNSGQLPKLLEAEPGIDIAQSGLFDFNINTRGFNSSLNRRVLVLLDGRDLGTAFLGATEWNGLSIPLEEMGRIEMVRGPGSALYGANAYNGVMNITSLSPRGSQGTKVIIGIGEPFMYRTDVRHAGSIGSWSYRVNAGTIRGKSFSRNRSLGLDSARKNVWMLTTDFEYAGFTPGVNNEAVMLDEEAEVSSTYGSARADYDFADGATAVIEGGTTVVKNEAIVTGIGRVQALEAARPWVRAHFQKNGLAINAWSNGRKNSQPDRSLSTGLALIQDAQVSQAEVQYAFSPFSDFFVVSGISQRFVSIDTKGSLMASARDDNMTGIFGQLEYQVMPTVRAIAAGRWDRSSLHPSQFSPKAAVVWTIDPRHSVRATYNRAFQSPNYSELYLEVRHPLKNVVYRGNNKLVPETITGYEIGYKGVFGQSLYVSTEVFLNILEEFVTDLGPGVNPDYLGPIILPGENFSRQVWSYVNAGKVQEAGLDLGVNYTILDGLTASANFSYFTFEVVSRHPNDVLIPNAPRTKANGAISYSSASGLDLGVTVKHVPAFQWAAGIYRGEIKAYTLVGFSASYPLMTSLTAALTVSNALDAKHYEIFGGSNLGRRSVLTVSYSL